MKQQQMNLIGINLIFQKRKLLKKLRSSRFTRRFQMLNFIQEEIRELELAGDFEAAAKIRQQLRDVKRLEKKQAEEAVSQAAAQELQGIPKEQ